MAICLMDCVKSFGKNISEQDFNNLQNSLLLQDDYRNFISNQKERVKDLIAIEVGKTEFENKQWKDRGLIHDDVPTCHECCHHLDFIEYTQKMIIASAIDDLQSPQYANDQWNYELTNGYYMDKSDFADLCCFLSCTKSLKSSEVLWFDFKDLAQKNIKNPIVPSSLTVIDSNGKEQKCILKDIQKIQEGVYYIPYGDVENGGYAALLIDKELSPRELALNVNREQFQQLDKDFKSILLQWDHELFPLLEEKMQKALIVSDPSEWLSFASKDLQTAFLSHEQNFEKYSIFASEEVQNDLKNKFENEYDSQLDYDDGPEFER